MPSDREVEGGYKDTSRLAFTTRPEAIPLEWQTLRYRQWPGVRLQYRRLSGPVSYDFSISGDANRFFLLDITRLDGETNITGLPRITNKELRDKFVFANCSCIVSGWSEIEKVAAFTLVELEAIDGDGISDLPPIFMQPDALLRSVLTQFKSLAIDQTSELPGDVEALCIMLRQQLRHLCAAKDRAEQGEGGLTPRQLRLAVSYIEDRLDREISIADMADNLGMSPFHFIRMFKKSAGVPPHKFYVARRIDRAKDLLRQPHLSISEVAEMSGFSGVSQLTRTFRKFVGTNPSSFRREHA